MFHAQIDRFLAHLHARAYSPRTLRDYREDLERLAQLLPDDTWPPPTQLIEFFLASHQDANRRAAPAHRNRRLSCLRSFFRYLVEQEGLPPEHDPTRGLRFSRLTRTTPSFLTYEDYLCILMAARRTKPDALRIRNEAIVVMLYNTGLRLSELVALDVSQYDPRATVLVAVRRKGGIVRDLPINRNVVHVLDRWLFVREEWGGAGNPALFLTNNGGRISGRVIQRGVATLAQSAGLTKRVSPHTFRHSHCTEIQLRGASIAVARELMDHSSIATTSRYSHATDRSLRVALAALDDPLTWTHSSLTR